MSSGEWQTQYETGDIGDDAAGDCLALGEYKYARIRLDQEQSDEDSKPREIRRTAFHENLETLLSPLRAMAEAHFSKPMVNREVHVVIRHFENSVFERLDEEIAGKEMTE